MGGEPAGRGAGTATTDRHSRDAAVTLALTLPGDTLLYVLLPLHHALFGVTLGEAGLLLAANRLVRIAGYGFVARFYAARGPRAACTLAALGAAAAALGYATLPGVWTLLPARLIWGLAFAAMNIATQALATAEPAGAARRNGLSRAIIAVGPMLGLPGGAALSMVIDPRAVFLVLVATSITALVFARRLPDGPGAPPRAAGPRVALPSRIDLWGLAGGITLDGLFVFGIAVLAATNLPESAALAAGTALALRYVAEITLSPLGGRWAERWGPARLLVLFSLGCAGGLIMIGVGWIWGGTVWVMVMRGLLQPLPAPVVARSVAPEERVPALARNATWRDIGAGIGPLAAGLLLPLVAPAWLYGGAALLLAAAALSVRR